MTPSRCCAISGVARARSDREHAEARRRGLGERGQVVGDRSRARRGIGRIGPASTRQRERAVLHRPREDADVVEAPRRAASTPAALIRPCVGLKPTTPQYAAGRSTEPTVCEPSASGTMRAATAAAGPLDEPPGVCSGFHGLRVALGSR